MKFNGSKTIYVTVWLMTCVHVTRADRDPARQADMMETYRVSNRFQCQRLCWYRKPCARFAFYTSTDNPGGKGDNCLLYANSDTNQEPPLTGWIEGGVSGDLLGAENTCQSRPCDNATICVPGFSSNVCLPVPPDNINDCHKVVCQNNGTCIDQLNNYTCQCQPGYNGRHCQSDILECASNPCQNNGTCVEETNGYTCSCQCGFDGLQCETARHNLALNKPARQSPPYNDGLYPPKHAVDGNATTDVTGCTHTNVTNTAGSWWQVDLESNCSVISVNITNRGGNCDEDCKKRLRNFTVTVHSNDPDTSGDEGVVCYHYPGTFPSGATQALSCYSNVRGRYLRITNTPNVILTLCEVEVFGGPATP